MLGKTMWAIPDGYMSDTKKGDLVSHEAICVLNASDQDARIEYIIYFEDREPLSGFAAICKAQRTNHIRLDKAVNDKNEKIPLCVPYAVLVKSDIPVIVQHSRMDVTQAEMTLMTTIAYS